MTFISHLLLTVLTSYIALSNHLATNLTTWFSSDLPDYVVTQAPAEPSAFLTQLPSRVEAIPDVLRTSAAYQQAAVAGAVQVDAPTATSPLEAIVNIYCTFRTSNQIKTTTGTGFFIDADGIIMTNAHVAQFLLLAASDDYGDATCTVRSGNPATPRYTASLLYIPPAWVQENAAILHDAVPMGTGERDYALLYVDQSVTGEPLPEEFPALAFDDALLSTSQRGAAVVAAGYPAGTLFDGDRDNALVPRQANTRISELYTFGSNTADVFSIKGSVVGAEGASGGPVVNEAGQVIGIIVTRGDDTTDGPGSLRAITLSHISHTIEEETGFTLPEHLGGDVATRSAVFTQTLTPFLVAMLQGR